MRRAPGRETCPPGETRRDPANPERILEEIAIAGCQQLAPAPVAIGNSEIEDVVHAVQEAEVGSLGQEAMRDVAKHGRFKIVLT